MLSALLQPVLALTALIVLAGLALALVRRRRPAALDLRRPWPLDSKGTLLSAPERALYGRLLRAASGHLVLSQVHLLQMVRFKRGARRQSIANRINQLSVDFLIVRPDTSIVAAVELDDASHRHASRRAADRRKTHALSSAGIPLLRWHVRQLPTVQTIERALAQALAGARDTLRQAKDS
jgi:very-short-patch-repair endonuclease